MLALEGGLFLMSESPLYHSVDYKLFSNIGLALTKSILKAFSRTNFARYMYLLDLCILKNP